MTAFRTLDSADVKGKRVLLRVDLNVPMENGRSTDAPASSACCRRSARSPTRAAKSSCWRISAAPRAGRTRPIRLRPSPRRSPSVLERPVAFASDCIGEPAAKAVAAMKDGDVLLLENTRFHKAEEKNDPAFVAELAKLGDIYVNDAFSAAHRAHASTEGVAHQLPAYAGRAMQAELDALTLALGSPVAPRGGDRRRRQGLDQARPARQSRQEGRHPDHRRRHGQHVPVRAGQGGRQIAVREGSRRHRALDPGGGASRQLPDPAAGRRRPSPRSSRRMRRRASSTSTTSPTTR